MELAELNDSNSDSKAMWIFSTVGSESFEFHYMWIVFLYIFNCRIEYFLLLEYWIVCQLHAYFKVDGGSDDLDFLNPIIKRHEDENLPQLRSEEALKYIAGYVAQKMRE